MSPIPFFPEVYFDNLYILSNYCLSKSIFLNFAIIIQLKIYDNYL